MENRTNTSTRTLSNDPRIDSPIIKVVYPAVESTQSTITVQGKPPVAVPEMLSTAPETKPMFDTQPVALTTYILPKGETLAYVQRQAIVNEDQTAKTTQRASVWDALKQNPTTLVVFLALIFALGYYVAKPKF
jgi:hypothetical protein